MATIPADSRFPSRRATSGALRAIVKLTREAPLAPVAILGGLILVAARRSAPISRAATS